MGRIQSLWTCRREVYLLRFSTSREKSGEFNPSPRAGRGGVAGVNLTRLFTGCGKSDEKPNPPAPFPTREWGEFKAYGLVGERFTFLGFQHPVKSQVNLTPPRVRGGVA